MNLRPWAAPTAVAVAIAGTATGVVLVTRSSSGSSVGSEPPKLALSSFSRERVAIGAPVSDASSSSYTLEGTLSDQKPDDGRVRRPTRGSAEEAAKLASALGLDGKPTEIKGGWALRGPDNTVLLLRSEGSWSWAMDCSPDQPIGEESLDVGCDMAISYVPPGPPPGPSAADTERVARPVFDALELSGDIRATQGEEKKSFATIEPASGAASTLWVSPALDVIGGNGWLAGSSEGDAYPLISAAAAFDALKAVPMMRDDMCRVRSDGKPGCEEPASPVVVGAHLGLMLDHDRSGALLVPAWLFELMGSTDTVPWVAIDPAYLEPIGDDPEQGSGSGSGSGSSGSTGSGGSGTGSVDPVPPDASPGTEPAPPIPQASPPPSDPNGDGTTSQTYPIDGYTLEGDRTIHVRVELGGCQADWEPRLEAKQGEDAVWLLLSASGDAPPADGACPAIAKVGEATVELDAPLGDRQVYDASTSKALDRRK